MKQTRMVVLAASAIWCALIVLAPIYHLQPVYVFFSRICHQDPARSWALAGNPLPVCIRCAAIYLGFSIAVGFAKKPNFDFLTAAIAATLIEFVMARLFLDSPWLRSATGLILGAAVAPFVIVG